MDHHISSVAVVRYPVVRITFDDGLSGEYDLADEVARGRVFEPLRDPSVFAGVRVAANGRSFGWNLDRPGEEIDFCSDAARIRIETAIVEELAARYAAARGAAE